MDITKKKILRSKMIDVEINQTEYNLETGKKKEKPAYVPEHVCSRSVPQHAF